MHVDSYGQPIFSEVDLCSLLMQDPNRVLQNVLVDKNVAIDPHLDLANIPHLVKYTKADISVSEFDQRSQAEWFMPKEYQEMDIVKWVLDQCTDEASLQRAGQELLSYSERDMISMLQYLKYLVDTMRKHKIVWGVGRGSSVSSYVLFLIGVHRIDSLFYDLSIDEFLK